jgi:hypothetical protein
MNGLIKISFHGLMLGDNCAVGIYAILSLNRSN